jgi:AraC-like DNA-binding protein
VDGAVEMLSEKELSFTEVALESGFSSRANLCAEVKRLRGMTPSPFWAMKWWPSSKRFAL